MKQFVITMRVLKEYPDIDSACAAVENMNGHWEDCIDFTVEEMSAELAAELAAEIIADHEVFDEIGGTQGEGEQTGTVRDFETYKTRHKH